MTTRRDCRYHYYKQRGCVHADRYGRCSISEGGRELPPVAYCVAQQGSAGVATCPHCGKPLRIKQRISLDANMNETTTYKLEEA